MVFMQTGIRHGLNDHRMCGTPLPIAEHCHNIANHLHYRNMLDRFAVSYIHFDSAIIALFIKINAGGI